MRESDPVAGSAEAPEPLPAREAAAAAVRRLGHALLAHDVDEADLRHIAEHVQTLADTAERARSRQRDLEQLARRMFGGDVADGAAFVHFDECFVSGPWNPLGVGIRVQRDGEGVLARIRLGAAFEGAPNMAHGGIVAALFDDVLGYLLTLHHVPAFTGELTVRYHRPTPVGTPLELHGWVVEREGRHLRAAGRLRSGEQLVASATAVFIEIDRAHLLGPGV